MNIIVFFVIFGLAIYCMSKGSGLFTDWIEFLVLFVLAIYCGAYAEAVVIFIVIAIVVIGAVRVISGKIRSNKINKEEKHCYSGGQIRGTNAIRCIRCASIYPNDMEKCPSCGCSTELNLRDTSK